MGRGERLEREDRIGKLASRLDDWDIKVIGVDLDGTLVDTKELFRVAMVEASKLLLDGLDGNTELTSLEIKQQTMDLVIMSLREELGVWPSIMETTVMIAARNIGVRDNHPSIEFALERVRDIYRKDVPLVFDGAKEMLSILVASGRRVYIMTHADPKWTRHKLDMTGLSGCYDGVVCFSIDRPKAEQWKEEFAKIGIKPQNWLVIGDNKGGDIVPTISLGGRAVLTNWDSGFYNTEKQTTDSGWQETLDSGRVTIANGIKDVVGALLG